jgi:hypothetical protein
MLEILHLEDGGEFDNFGRHAIAVYVSDPFGDNDTNKDETSFTKFRGWVLHLCFLWLYHYLGVGKQTLVVAKTDIIAICDWLGNNILPFGTEATLTRINRIAIANQIHILVRRLLKITAADFSDLNINELIGRTFRVLTNYYRMDGRFSTHALGSPERRLIGFAAFLIRRIIFTRPENTCYEQNDNVFYSMVDSVCIRLEQSFSAHNPTIKKYDREFSDNVCADIILHICLLLAERVRLPTITFEAMHGMSSVAVPLCKPELPSRGRKRSRKKSSKKSSKFPAIV